MLWFEELKQTGGSFYTEFMEDQCIIERYERLCVGIDLATRHRATSLHQCKR